MCGVAQGVAQERAIVEIGETGDRTAGGRIVESVLVKVEHVAEVYDEVRMGRAGLGADVLERVRNALVREVQI